MSFDLARKKAFICDLDGTLFMGAKPIASAVDFVIRNTQSGRFSFFYLTNNTSKTPEQYMQKLTGAGIPVVPEQILTPLITLESYIREKKIRSVYLVATDKVTEHMKGRLQDDGVEIGYNPGVNELAVLTYDVTLTYEKMRRLSVLHNLHRTPFVATHPDCNCPSEEGPIPDVGAMLKMFEAVNGMKPIEIFGKPSPSLLEPVFRHFKAEEMAMVGDRLHTDKAIADNAGIDFVCVLSGETQPADLERYQGSAPAIVVETFDKVECAR